MFAHESEDYDHDAWFSAYTPQAEDGCYIEDTKAGLGEVGKDGARCWFHLACGRVLGVHNGIVIEYDASTLAPLGLVVSKVRLRRAPRWPAWKCVSRVVGPSHPGTPTLSL